MPEFKLNIVTPDRNIFSGNVISVTVPGTLGSFQVLYNHAPLISTFEIGLVKVEPTQGEYKYFATSGGTIEVLKNNVLVLADSLELVEDIDVERAEEAKKRAEERLSKRDETTDIERAEIALKRAVNRLNIANKYIRGLA